MSFTQVHQEKIDSYESKVQEYNDRIEKKVGKGWFLVLETKYFLMLHGQKYGSLSSTRRLLYFSEQTIEVTNVYLSGSRVSGIAKFSG